MAVSETRPTDSEHQRLRDLRDALLSKKVKRIDVLRETVMSEIKSDTSRKEERTSQASLTTPVKANTKRRLFYPITKAKTGSPEEQTYSEELPVDSSNHSSQSKGDQQPVVIKKIIKETPKCNELGTPKCNELGTLKCNELGKTAKNPEKNATHYHLIKQFQKTYLTNQPLRWETVEVPLKTEAQTKLAARFRSRVQPDTLVVIDASEFPCHLVLLQCYCQYFEELDPGLKGSRIFLLPAEKVSPEVFPVLYDWMAESPATCYKLISRNNVMPLLTAADFLVIPDLQEQCWALLNDEDTFQEETAMAALLEAREYGMREVAELMVSRISKFFLPLVGSEFFQRLPLDVLVSLLRSNHIAVHEEIEVYMAAVKWLSHEWSTRVHYAMKVMSCVRFGLMQPCQLVDIRRNPGNPELLQAASLPPVAEMIDLGVAYAVHKMHFSGEDKKWLLTLQLEEPEPRKWINDGETTRYNSYVDFLAIVEARSKESIRSS